MTPIKAYYLDLKSKIEAEKSAILEKRKIYKELHRQFTKEDKNNKVDGELSILKDYLEEYNVLEDLLNTNIIELEKHFDRLDRTLNNIGSTLDKLENLENKSFDKVDLIGKTLGF